MSGATIRISDGSFPDISAIHDIGQKLDITNINDLDLGLLGNQKKINGTPSRSAPSGVLDVSDGGGGGGGDGIEFVNLDDVGITYDVKPSANTGDTIKIMRDGPIPAANPIESTGGPTLKLNFGSDSSPFAPAPAAAPPPPATKSWFSSLPGMSSSSSSGGGGGSSGGGGLFSSFFGGKSSAPPAVSDGITTEETHVYLTPEQETVKKTEGLTLLERMDRKGVGGNKMTMANTLDEINAELARRKDSKGLEASLRFQRSMMTTVTSGMEFLNNRYDPLGLSLDGWSEQVNENIEDYDEIFEELYDKYKDKSKVAPEVRLVMSLGLSAAMCHITNTMFKSKMPGMDDILRNNPDLARQMAQAAAQHSVGPGFANFVGLGMPTGRPAAQRAPPPQQQYRGPPTPQNEMDSGPAMFMPPMGSGMGGEIPTKDPRGAPTARREMAGPSGVDDILSQLAQGSGGIPQRAVPPPVGLDAEDLGSVGSGMTTETMRRAGVSRRRKVTSVQPTGATLTLNV